MCPWMQSRQRDGGAGFSPRRPQPITFEVMEPGKSRHRRAATCSIVALALAYACALAAVPAAARAAATRPSDGALSPRLAELAKPSVRTAPPEKQAEALSLVAEGPGSLLREGNRVLVDVRFDHGAAAAVDDLRAAGAEIIDVSPRYQTVTVAAKPSELTRLSSVPRVAGVIPVLTPFTSVSTCPSGVAVSEGDAQLRAAEARTTFAVEGTGVTVGILSDSFNKASEAADGSGPIATKEKKDIETGDLPGALNTCIGESTPTKILDDSFSQGADEGRAMAQIVHDLAPRAKLAFATAFKPNVFGFADNVRKLAKPLISGGAEADVIADDVSYFEEPFFQEGPVDVAVREVTEGGAAYFSAAGNDNLFDSSGHEIASWETPAFRDSGSCPPVVQAVPGAQGTHCLDFNPGSQVDKTFGIKVAPGATLTVDLQWNEPWLGVATDLDAFLLNSTGGLIAASGEDNIGESQMPFELIQWVNESGSQQTVQLVVNRFSGGSPRLKLAMLENGFGVTDTEYPRSTGSDVVGPTLFGHSGAADTISVGAVPFNDSSTVEKYSSRGPVAHYFGPVEGTEPAEALTPAETLSKPDLVATDCGRTTFFAFLKEGVWRFCGTSAAAPHAAGVAALMLDDEPAAGPAQVRAALLAGAAPVGEFGACAVGAGLVDAVESIKDLLTPPSPVEPDCSPPASEGSVEEAQAPGNWGSETPPPPPVQTSPEPTSTPPVVTTDQTRPRTFFKKRPAKVIRTRGRKAKAVFKFGSNESGVTFLCRVDGAPFRKCRAQFVRRYKIGRHILRVIARDAAGNADRTPAVFRFQVKHIG
jgi:subtilisin family serine protease